MLNNSSLLSKWQKEYFAPVVITVATAEVERICLDNGLLFHELLSAFGHLDAVNASIRSANQMIPISSAHIRFERISEVVHKNSGVIEELLRDTFEEFDIQRLPLDMREVKQSPPSGWSPKIEEILMRSVSFSEFEMVSHPLIFLTAVSTSDTDPVACMKELKSPHHMPPCFFTGQYDPDIHRVFLLVHDNSFQSKHDVNTLLREMRAALSPSVVRLLCLNSLPAESPNLQQPDLWADSRHPLFYPQHAPTADPSANHPLPIHPSTLKPVVGCRLSLEDCMSLRTCCLELYLEDVIPALEKRLNALSRVINDNRKGVKNVLKSFWRKPREEGSHSKGQAKYRYDRIESQILLYADTSFGIKDYETASSMYRLVRDDYKADKSLPHLAYTSLMIAVCQLAGEVPSSVTANTPSALAAAALLRSSGNHREMTMQFEVLTMCIVNGMEPAHIGAYFSLLAAELHTSPALVAATRAPLEAAHVLLQAAAGVTKLPLLCALLTERAAGYFLQAGQMRKYVFHEVLAGHKYHVCGSRAIKQAVVCFAVAMLHFDATRWSTIKAKLSRALADELRDAGSEESRRSLLLLLRVLGSGKESDVLFGWRCKTASQDAVGALREICTINGPWGALAVREGWRETSTRAILLDDIPVQDIRTETQRTSVIEGLAVPQVIRNSSTVLLGFNGFGSLCNGKYKPSSTVTALSTTMKAMFQLEKDWVKRMSKVSSQDTPTSFPGKSLAQLIADFECNDDVRSTTTLLSAVAVSTLCLGEILQVQIELQNHLPVNLLLTEMKLEVDTPESFKIEPCDCTIPANSTNIVILTATPLQTGKFKVLAVHWNLGWLFVRQSLLKEGPLLHRTLAQRSRHERGEDTSLDFEVSPPHALLKLDIDGIPGEVLQGEISQGSLTLTNEGGATACDIEFKFSLPCCLLSMGNLKDQYLSEGGRREETGGEDEKHLTWIGQSGTVIRLPPGILISPGDSLRLTFTTRLDGVGASQLLVVLASYAALRQGGEGGGGGGWDGKETAATAVPTPCRTSSTAIEINVLPSLSVHVKSLTRSSDTSIRMMIIDLQNTFGDSSLMASNFNIFPLPLQATSTSTSISTGPNTSSSNFLQCGTSKENHHGMGSTLEYGSCTIECIWVLGSGGKTTVFNSNTSNSSASLSMKVSEKRTMCYPLQISVAPPSPFLAHDSNKMRIISQQSWLLPLPPSNPLTHHLLENFLTLAFTSSQFRNAVERAKVNRKSETISTAPRSISSVRRENQSEKIKVGDSSKSEKLVVTRIRSTVDVFAVSAASLSSASLPADNVPKQPSHQYGLTSAPEIANYHAATRSVSVAIGWSFQHKDRICRGVSYVFDSPFLTSSSSSNNANIGKAYKMAADYLSVAVTHPAQVTLLPVEAGPSLLTVAATSPDNSISVSTSAPISSKSVLVEVTVKLSSTSSQPITVWADAIDWDRNQDVMMAASTSGHTPSSGMTSFEDGVGRQLATQGCRWLGKVRYEAIQLLPFEDKQLLFFAYITRSGVYDLKSFRMTVDFTDDNASTPSVRHLPGQSLIEVLDDGPFAEEI